MNENRFIDLHTHSACSDGSDSPTELVQKAKTARLQAVALTDHDTVSGLLEFEQAAANAITPICGIELSSLYQEETEIHIVGLLIDKQNAALLSLLHHMQDTRKNRNRLMAEKLQALGFSITIEEVQKEAGGKILSRVHYAALLEKKGYVANRREAFEKYLTPQKPAYVKRDAPSPEECIKSILAAGGVPILAHPTLYQMTPSELETLVRDLKSTGLLGIETRYSSYTHRQEQEIAALCRRFSLLPSGGSDYHGTNKPGLFLGFGYGRLRVPAAFLDAMIHVQTS